jgi:hypothetical protein
MFVFQFIFYWFILFIISILCICSYSVVSDGVHDNFDPMHIGKQPKDLGILEYTNWDDIPDNVVNAKKTVC